MCARLWLVCTWQWRVTVFRADEDERTHTAAWLLAGSVGNCSPTTHHGWMYCHYTPGVSVLPQNTRGVCTATTHQGCLFCHYTPGVSVLPLHTRGVCTATTHQRCLYCHYIPVVSVLPLHATTTQHNSIPPLHTRGVYTATTHHNSIPPLHTTTPYHHYTAPLHHYTPSHARAESRLAALPKARIISLTLGSAQRRSACWCKRYKQGAASWILGRGGTWWAVVGTQWRDGEWWWKGG